jgi:hypothetical protein
MQKFFKSRNAEKSYSCSKFKYKRRYNIIVFFEQNNLTFHISILTLPDLYNIALGTYQLKQVKSYYVEHCKIDGRFEIQVCRHTGPLQLTSHDISADDPMLIRGRIQNRHRNSTKYYIYVLDFAKSGAESLIEYCCQCKRSLRTVGRCAHIMTVLWFLGYGRYHPEIRNPAASLDEVCCVLESTDND